jgi:hypothetical protein
MNAKHLIPFGSVLATLLVGLPAARAQAPKAPAAGDKNALPTNALVVEAFIDGPSELRVKKDGIYWINGENAKPGRHARANEATYVNGKAWMPVWKKHTTERGVDRSNAHAISPAVDPSKLDLKLVSVTIQRGGAGIDQRDALKVNMADQELSILIPDGQSGARWYKIALIPK